MGAAEQHEGRVCARGGCGNSFTPARSDARYCSGSCRALASRGKRNETQHDVADNRPAPFATVTVISPPGPLIWDPPSEPRGPCQTGEPCPECGAPLVAEPRGIWQACFTCKRRVTPSGVLTPYVTGDGAAPRTVRSRAERDLDELALEDRKGPMLDQLDALAGSGKLDTASLRKIRRFREWVDDAQSDARLDELVELFRQADIRPRRWWHARPAAELDSADNAGNGDGQGDEDDYPRAIEAPSAVAGDYAAGLAARNWVLQPHGAGICHVVELTPHGWDYIPPESCLRRASRIIPGGAVCDGHHQAITAGAA